MFALFQGLMSLYIGVREEGGAPWMCPAGRISGHDSQFGHFDPTITARYGILESGAHGGHEGHETCVAQKQLYWYVINVSSLALGRRFLICGRF